MHSRAGHVDECIFALRVWGLLLHSKISFHDTYRFMSRPIAPPRKLAMVKMLDVQIDRNVIQVFEVAGRLGLLKSGQIVAEDGRMRSFRPSSCAQLAFSCNLAIFNSSGANYAGPSWGGDSDCCSVDFKRGEWPRPTSACNVGIGGPVEMASKLTN